MPSSAAGNVRLPVCPACVCSLLPCRGKFVDANSDQLKLRDLVESKMCERGRVRRPMT